MVLAAGLAPALATLSTSCLCIGLRELLARRHKDGASSRCCPGRIALQKKSAGYCVQAGMVAVSSAALDTAGLISEAEGLGLRRRLKSGHYPRFVGLARRADS